MNFLAQKTTRNNFIETNSDIEEYSFLEDFIFNKQPKDKKRFKTIQKIKEETIQEYNNLSSEEKKNNEKLLKLIEKFDIIDIINYNLLNNDLNNIKELSKEKNSQKSVKCPKDIFIEDYKQYRYTLLTNQRIIF